MKVFILVLLLLPTLFAITYAASNKEEFELQERCANFSEAIFKREYGDGISNTADGQLLTGYSNHYNKKLNKCFMLQTITDIKYKGSSSTSMFLFDIHENKDYGSFFRRWEDVVPFECRVLGKFCHSENEWNSLIKTYMEE